MAELECRAVGTVAEAQVEELTQLLMGLSGCAPQPVEQREVVLQAPASTPAPNGVPAGWKPDLRLQQDLEPSTSGRQLDAVAEDTSAWTALQFSLHLRGKQHAALPAVVRHVSRAQCRGAGVPAFWAALGFTPRYQLLRRGHHFLLSLGGQEMDVSVCRVLRLPPVGGGGAAGAASVVPELSAGSSPLQQVSPGRLVVEVVAAVPAEADHMDSVAAVAQLAALLAPYTTLQRPPRAPGEPL